MASDEFISRGFRRAYGSKKDKDVIELLREKFSLVEKPMPSYFKEAFSESVGHYMILRSPELGEVYLTMYNPPMDYMNKEDGIQAEGEEMWDIRNIRNKELVDYMNKEDFIQECGKRYMDSREKEIVEQAKKDGTRYLGVTFNNKEHRPYDIDWGYLFGNDTITIKEVILEVPKEKEEVLKKLSEELVNNGYRVMDPEKMDFLKTLYC